MKQAHIFISGFVQGVGFRFFLRDNAEKLGLTGWVRNTIDNRVETVLQGDKQKIEQLIKLCHKGPFLAEVKDVVVEWGNVSEAYNDFTVKHL